MKKLLLFVLILNFVASCAAGGKANSEKEVEKKQEQKTTPAQDDLETM